MFVSGKVVGIFTTHPRVSKSDKVIGRKSNFGFSGSKSILDEYPPCRLYYIERVSRQYQSLIRISSLRACG
jgi:hypothetical protein